MKIVFDTNVLISGFLTATGPSQHVFKLAVKRHTVILSEFILGELEKNLAGKLGVPSRVVEPLLEFLRKRALVLEAEKPVRTDFPDKSDLPILGLAETSKAHYLITGDKKLLALKKIGQTLILTPREALEIL